MFVYLVFRVLWSLGLFRPAPERLHSLFLWKHITEDDLYRLLKLKDLPVFVAYHQEFSKSYSAHRELDGIVYEEREEPGGVIVESMIQDINNARDEISSMHEGEGRHIQLFLSRIDAMIREGGLEDGIRRAQKLGRVI
jgi:hypothetical protein